MRKKKRKEKKIYGVESVLVVSNVITFKESNFELKLDSCIKLSRVKR